MKKVLISMAVFSMFFFITSCSVTMPLTATSNSNKEATKTGISKASFIFNIPLSGDASIATAVKNGNIDKVSTVDVKTTSFLGLFNTIETTVKGNR